MKSICENLNKNEVEISNEDMEAMMNYNWPGNIRELENIVELIINTESIPKGYFIQDDFEEDIEKDEKLMSLEDMEKQHIIKVLEKNKGNISRSASDLGIRRNTLYNKIKKQNIKAQE
jgi:transcriptional regulator of acetoin/glycerol metabolism